MAYKIASNRPMTDYEQRMAEYIERDNWIVKPTVTEAIENLSTENEVRYRGTVTVSMQEYRPVVHGHWEWEEGVHVYGVDSKNQHGSVRCSACGNCSPHSTNYCPICGADMRPE